MTKSYHMERYMRQISEKPLLSQEEELDLARRIQRGDREARDRMVEANLLLVAKVAHDYIDRGLPFEDLIAEGNVGLIKAVERFDPEQGSKLSTYAVWWIKQCIKRALGNQGRTIRLPIHMQDKMAKLARIRANLTEELGREPSLEETSELTGIPMQKLTVLEDFSQYTCSLDAPVGEEDGRETLGDLVADQGAKSPDEAVADRDLVKRLAPGLKKLGPRERKILELRFGLHDREPMTLVEIGKLFGVTRERIRQLQNIALAELKTHFSLLEDPNLCAASAHSGGTS